MTTTQDANSGQCSTCGQPVSKVDGLWVHDAAADGKYCDEIAKPARVQAILNDLQAGR